MFDRHIKKPIHCPYCDQIILPCDWAGCTNYAEYEGWHSSGLITRRNVCEEHVVNLRGYDKFIQQEIEDEVK